MMPSQQLPSTKQQPVLIYRTQSVLLLLYEYN
jgi:hypothetical protein